MNRFSWKLFGWSILAVLLFACEGKDGNDGKDGAQGPQGEKGPPGESGELVCKDAAGAVVGPYAALMPGESSQCLYVDDQNNIWAVHMEHATVNPAVPAIDSTRPPVSEVPPRIAVYYGNPECAGQAYVAETIPPRVTFRALDSIYARADNVPLGEVESSLRYMRGSDYPGECNSPDANPPVTVFALPAITLTTPSIGFSAPLHLEWQKISVATLVAPDAIP